MRASEGKKCGREKKKRTLNISFFGTHTHTSTHKPTRNANLLRPLGIGNRKLVFMTWRKKGFQMLIRFSTLSVLFVRTLSGGIVWFFLLVNFFYYVEKTINNNSKLESSVFCHRRIKTLFKQTFRVLF